MAVITVCVCVCVRACMNICVTHFCVPHSSAVLCPPSDPRYRLPSLSGTGTTLGVNLFKLLCVGKGPEGVAFRDKVNLTL